MRSMDQQMWKRQHTKSQGNDTHNALNTGDPLATQELAIVESNITRRSIDDQGRRGGVGWGRKGILSGRRVDIDVAKGLRRGHIWGLRCKEKGMKTEDGEIRREEEEEYVERNKQQRPGQQKQ